MDAKLTKEQDVVGIMVDKLRELENKFELAIRREKEAYKKINNLEKRVVFIENLVKQVLR